MNVREKVCGKGKVPREVVTARGTLYPQKAIKSYDDAVEECSGLGLRLASIYDRETRDAAALYIRCLNPYHLSETLAIVLDDASQAWSIGLRFDDDDVGRWFDGTPYDARYYSNLRGRTRYCRDQGCPVPFITGAKWCHKRKESPRPHCMFHFFCENSSTAFVTTPNPTPPPLDVTPLYDFDDYYLPCIFTCCFVACAVLVFFLICRNYYDLPDDQEEN